MKTVSKLVAAALLATAAAPALAHDCDRDAQPVGYPAPAPGAWHDGRWDRDGRWDHDGRWDQDGDRDGRWRHDGWREQERAQLRSEYARLDDRRSDFYARWGWNRRKVERFERWYAAERADLDRRWAALAWRYAAR